MRLVEYITRPSRSLPLSRLSGVHATINLGFKVRFWPLVALRLNGVNRNVHNIDAICCAAPKMAAREQEARGRG